MSISRSPRGNDSTAGIFRHRGGKCALQRQYIYTVADNSLVVRLDFADIRPALWADAAPALAGLAALDVPFSGEVVAVIDGTQLMLRDATWDVSLGAGQIKHDVFEGGVLALSGARMQGGYDPARQRLNIGLMTVQLAHGGVGVSGTVDGIGGELFSGAKPPALDLHLVLAAEALKVDDLPALWPDNANPDTRSWVTQHLHDGTIDQLQAQLGLHVDLTPGAAQAARLDQFEGNFAFSGSERRIFPAVAAGAECQRNGAFRSHRRSSSPHRTARSARSRPAPLPRVSINSTRMTSKRRSM